jgi:predicted DNA binding CopG/RHH family protein
MKKQLKNDPFVNLVLDEEEKALEAAFEKGAYQESPTIEDTKKMLAEAATRYLELNVSKPITIRVNQLDLIKVKAKAKLKQIPYQTLLGSLIHLYAEGEKDFSL